MKCPQCNTIASDSSKFCPVCGMPLDLRICKNCSAPLGEGAKFCAKCGAEQIEHKFCGICNAPLEENAKFCTTCGASTEPPKDPAEDECADKALVFGILGAAFSLSFWLSFLGIIFSAIGLSKFKKYIGYAGEIKNAKAAVGRGLSIGGLATGIFFTFIAIIYICAVIALLV